LGRSDRSAGKTLLLVLALLAYGFASAQTLYKYRGENGEWIFSDRPPDDRRDAEIRTLDSRAIKGEITVTHSFTGDGFRFTAQNRFFAPMEVAVEFASIEGVEYPHPDEERRWVVPARSDLVLLDLTLLGDVEAPSVQYRYSYLPGDPRARPAEGVSYRAPFTLGSSFPITQTYPDSLTHRTRDSMHAVDFEMPVGTDVVAARDGIVFDVSSTNFKGGQDAEQYAELANLVRILHDDGTYALYGHLNWNSIRVRPGDRVKAGQHIADSGNTGFTTGPHLHFAVQRNMGMRVDSIPVEFRGADNTRVTPATGSELTAYP
jgi:murein DD-endopeptidase MepM/ murein hydrolase activator NlpD